MSVVRGRLSAWKAHRCMRCVACGLSAVLYSSVISLCAALKEHDEAWRLLHEMFAAEMQARGSGLPPRRMTLFVRTCVASQPMRWAWHRRA